MERWARRREAAQGRGATTAPSAGSTSDVRKHAPAGFASVVCGRQLQVRTNAHTFDNTMLGSFIRRTIPLSATLSALIALPVLAQRADLEKVIQRRVLPNGLEVIVVENHGVP